MKKFTALLLMMCMVLSLMPMSALAADVPMKSGKTYIVLTPASFADLGEWQVTTEAGLGFNFMLGGKDGHHVNKHPSTEIVLPKDGTYKIYVLGKDHTSGPGTRYFDVILGDVSYRTGNHGQLGFAWQSSGELKVKAGKATLKLNDVIGNYPRCALIVISDDLDFKPGNDAESVAALAAKAYVHDGSVTTVATIEGESTGGAPEQKPAEQKPAEQKPAVTDKPAEPSKALKEGKTYIILNNSSFKSLGDWHGETDKSGVYYITGGTAAKPVINNPTTKIVLPRDGVYKIYSYAKDFTSAPGSRHFEVVLGNNAVTQRLGNHGKEGFFWQGSAEFPYFGGETTLKISDSSGNSARVAMVVVTDDLEFKPEDSLYEMQCLALDLYKDGDVTCSETAVPGRPDTEIAVMLNGEWMQFDVPPVLMNDRTMVPFRAIFEALGCTVSWDDETQTAIGVRNGAEIELPIGSEKAFVAGNGCILDQPAVLKDGRTLVPLRFVSEALGAQVQWIDETQTVKILATIPDEMVFVTMQSFYDVGTWRREGSSSDAFNDSALRGLIPDKVNATPEDADASGALPAIANIDVLGGTYYVWGHAKDFSANLQGSRYMNVGFDDMPMMENRMGDHGGQGYAWECLGAVDLTKGRHQLKVYDTSGFYARFDGVLLTKDANFIPPETYVNITTLVSPVTSGFKGKVPFPKYANEQAVPTESYTIENDKTKVVFYKVPTSKGQVVQREIYSKSNGAWVKTTARDENLGYFVIRADEAKYLEERELISMSTTFTYGGVEYSTSTVNPYAAGVGEWFVPTDFVVDGDKVILSAAGEYGTLTAAWSMDDNTAPLVSIDMTFAKDGFYTIGAHEGKSFAFEQFEYALAPFRVAYKRVSDRPWLYTESYLFTPMGTHTLYANNEYSALPVTKGVVVEPSWIPVRWVYADNNLFGITMNDTNNMHQGAVFAPLLGAPESKMQAGSTYNMQVRMVSTVKGWFENYEDTVTNLFDVTDYRKNHVVSLNQTIFNTRETALDDKYGGWDVYDKSHYNMESGNITSNANTMQYMQDYLLSEDEEMLTRRAIPTMVNALTRGALFFNRKGTTDDDYFQKVNDPTAMGTPVTGFNANVWGGMYEMTRGMVPFLHQHALVKGQQAVTNSYGSVAPFVNDLNMYKYTGDKQYLDKAIAAADEYLEYHTYNENTTMPAWESFIWISYYPNLGSLMDIYEATGDKKYLDAAEETAKWMATAFWVPGVDGTRKTDKIIMVNDWEEMQNRIWIAKNEAGRTYWWAGETQLRAGREENLAENPESLKNITDRTRLEEGWLASRTGLGIEQASTFKNGLNIIMQSFVGDYMKLAAYTGNDFYATMAKNAIIGRFSDYDGYYRAAYTTYQQEVDYPREGPDYTNLYWHHIPPYLAMLEDFLINQTFAMSNQNIHFPSLRQNGYAYFNSNQYGHQPGKFFEETEMWPWLAEDTVLPDSIQINWMAARKDGVMGVAFMNEDHVDTTTTVTLGDKVPGGKNYSGTAVLYDENGKIGNVDVVNGAFTLTVPAKGFRAVKLNIPEVTAPTYADVAYDVTSADVGATVTEHKNGKGYTLQMSPDFYYAYVYTTTNQRKIQSATLTYTVNGETKTETATVYPFEFIIKVDDPKAEFKYTLSEKALDGTVTELGGGTLMTSALSKEKGINAPIVEKAPTEAAKPVKVEATKEAKALKFSPTTLAYSGQGCDSTGKLRFVLAKEGLPFEPNEKNVVGLTLSGVLTTRENTTLDFKTVVIGYEDRGTKMVLITEPTADVTSAKYGSDNKNQGNYEWSDMILGPVEK